MVKKFFPWFVIYFTLILVVVWPFIQKNDLDIWDTSSHLQAIWFVKSYLWPNFTGWNPFGFAGYPQNFFYPPLVHYLGATLGMFMPIQWALKLIILLPILLQPVVIYKFARLQALNYYDSLTITFFYLWAAAVMSTQVGGSYRATFETGLVVNNVGILLFFILLYYLQKKNFLVSSIVFSCIVLTHLPTTFAATLALLCYGLLNFKQYKKQLIAFIITSFCLTAFWLVPFIVYKNEMTIYSLGVSQNEIFQLVFVFSYVILIYKHQRQIIQFFLMPLVILMTGILLIYVPNSSVHIYRLTNFAYWFLPFAVFYALKERGLVVNRLLLIFIALCYPFFLMKEDIAVTSYYKYQVNLPVSVPGRVLTNYELLAPQQMPHYFNDIISMHTEQYTASGLFMEGSLNSRYILHLLYKLSPHNFVWGLNISQFMQNAFLTIDQEELLKLFNITHLIAFKSPDTITQTSQIIDTPPNPSGIGKNSRFAMVLEHKNDSKLIEVVENLTPVYVKRFADWKNAVDQWYFSNPLPPLLVKLNNPIESMSPQSTGGGEVINIQYISKTQDNLKFRVEADHPVPVLIKISYFPKWQATQHGKPIPIYRVSPNLMMILAKGDIQMQYQDQSWEKLLRIISLVSWICIIVTILIKKIIPWLKKNALYLKNSY